MGDFSDPRDFTERDVKEILEDDYIIGNPPFKGLQRLFDDINRRRFDYKLQAWKMSYADLKRIASRIAVEQLEILKNKVS